MEPKELPTMSLSCAKAGSRVRLRRIDAGLCLQARLAAMGLRPGVEVDVVRSSFGGPAIVGVKGSRVMLGHGMTQRIEVE